MKQSALLLYGSLTVGLVVTLFGTFEPYDNSWFALGITFNDCSMQFNGHNETINIVKQQNGIWESIEFEDCQTEITDTKAIITKRSDFGTLVLTYDKTEYGVKSIYEVTAKDIQNTKLAQVIDINNEATD